MSGPEPPNRGTRIQLPKILSYGSADLFAEEVEPRPQWEVDFFLQLPFAVKAFASKVLTQKKECVASREMAERSVRMSASFPVLDVSTPEDTKKPHVMSLSSDDNLSAPADSGNR